LEFTESAESLGSDGFISIDTLWGDIQELARQIDDLCDRVGAQRNTRKSHGKSSISYYNVNSCLYGFVIQAPGRNPEQKNQEPQVQITVGPKRAVRFISEQLLSIYWV
jgi:hypothetical protein